MLYYPLPAFLAELVKTHIEEVKRLWPNIRRAKGEFVVKCLGVSFDAFRQEVWVRAALRGLKTACINTRECEFENLRGGVTQPSTRAPFR